LPEKIGGVRNWDYRYCWLRDAALSLLAMLNAGYTDEAGAWRDWLVRTVAGDPSELQIMYGVAGERRLLEFELDWLEGYEGSRPIRVGQRGLRAAADRRLRRGGRRAPPGAPLGLARIPISWALQRKLLDFLTTRWQEPDEGIWEIRGPRRQFTHSKVMAWVAFDRAVKAVEDFDLPGSGRRVARAADAIHAQVCDRGLRRRARLLRPGLRLAEARRLAAADPPGRLPPATDRRVIGTVDAISARCVRDGFVLRYETEDGPSVDGLPPGEGAFLACTFWLVDNLALMGRIDEARALYERLLGLRNDLGLLAGGVGHHRGASGRELPAGVLAPRAHQLRLHHLQGGLVARGASRRLRTPPPRRRATRGGW
jgi:GH15 family glucan-1,4-alpha-glucosidase